MFPKRLFDAILTVLAMPLWLPLAGAVALVVAIADGRPVVFSQMRAGLGGVPFKMRKFRTMREAKSAGEDDVRRVTRLGRLLRATSLDELPQLFHVLSGRMSLVGPRPLPVAYVERYNAEQRRRLDVPPGITGWAQVNGRNALNWNEKFALDVWYVDNRSLALDAKIIALTVKKVFARDGIDHGAGETMPEFRP